MNKQLIAIVPKGIPPVTCLGKTRRSGEMFFIDAKNKKHVKQDIPGVSFAAVTSKKKPAEVEEVKPVDKTGVVTKPAVTKEQSFNLSSKQKSAVKAETNLTEPSAAKKVEKKSSTKKTKKSKGEGKK